MDTYSIFPLDPAKISWNSKIKPKWDVTKYVSAGQGRKTLTHQAYPTWQFDITFPMLSAAEVDTLLAFHMFCKGGWNPFFYKDYERHDANVTLKDGNTYYYKANGLPLIIPLSVGGYTFGEPCYMADCIRVYRDGVEDTENFEVEADASGALRVYLTDVETDEGTLQSTVITATYEYYYKVAFQDSITVTEKFADIYSVSLTLESVKQTVTDVGDNDLWQGDEVYNITLNQTSHQTITAKRYKAGQVIGTYTSSFQMIGSDIIEVTVEADEGYVPGMLNINGVKYASPARISVNENLFIAAEVAEPGSVVYMDGTMARFTSTLNRYYVFFSDEACTTRVDKGNLTGKITVIDVSNGLPYWGTGILGDNSSFSQRCTQVRTADVSDIDVQYKTDFSSSMAGCAQLFRIIGLNAWNPVSATTFANLFGSSTLLADIGDISHWNTPDLTSLGSAFNRTALTSIDLHYWNTPSLTTVNAMCEGCPELRVIDISGLNTANVTNVSNMFSSCTALRYIIMDRNDVMFSGDYPMPAPTNNTIVEYLVPASLVDTYKAHANWSSRASSIKSLDDYIITRNNGSITVTAR